jgi:uncharacterized membrane protein YkoI
MFSFGKIGSLAVLGLSLALGSSQAAEEKIPLNKVPKAVIDAFKTKFPKAEIKNAIKEEADGKTVYEVESTRDGLTIDAMLKPDGAFVEIEQEIKTSSLPAVVAAAVKTKHPKAKLKKAEEVTKDSKMIYEVVVETTDGKEAEVAVDKDGKIIG